MAECAVQSGSLVCSELKGSGRVQHWGGTAGNTSDSSAFNFELIFLLLCVRKHFTIVKIFAIPKFSYIAHDVET